MVEHVFQTAAKAVKSEFPRGFRSTEFGFISDHDFEGLFDCCDRISEHGKSFDRQQPGVSHRLTQILIDALASEDLSKGQIRCVVGVGVLGTIDHCA